MIRKKHITASIAALLSITLIFYFVSSRHEHHLDIKGKFKVTNPWHENIDINEEYVAQIRAIQHIEIRSIEKGYLQSIHVDEGQFVKKDQKMFQIMPLLIKAEFKKFKAEYELAEIEYKNTKILQKQNVVSKNELALSKAKLDKADAEVELAKAHLEFATIKAPFDGIMDRFHVRLGSLVEEGQLLTTLSDTSQVWVYFNVSESDYLDYMQHKKADKKMPIKLVLANGTMFPYDGVIDTIEAEFNNEVGNVAFRASFPNPDGLLRHGETGTVLLNKKHDDALVIPQKATFEILEKKFVYVVDDENKIHSRQIEIAEEVPHLFLISSGITDKDKILLEGFGKVREDQEIKTEYENSTEVKKGLMLEAQ